MALWLFLPEGLRNFLLFTVQPSQLPYTVVLGILLFYWIFVIAGAFDIEIFGIDADTDLETPDGPLAWVLSWFYVGDLPIMIIITLVVMGIWVAAMATGMALPQGTPGLLRFALIPVNLGVGALAAVPAIKLIAFFWKQNDNAQERIKEEGSLAHLRSALVPGAMGQALIDRRGAPVMLNVKLTEGEEALPAGAEVVVLAKEGGYFLVKRFS
jgi:hypothetical protein